MVEEKLKIVEMEQQNNEIVNVCRKLWENNFDDSDEYIRYYFEDRWKESITFLYDNKSMLHLNPYNMKIFGKKEKIYYIVGVCTDKEERHKGYMDLILRNAFEKLYDKKAPFVYLMPASENIYIPYGFRGMYEVTSFNAVKKESDVSEADTGCRIIKFNDLSDRMQEKLLKYASVKLSSHFECFAERDISYFYHKNKEMEACFGSVLVLIKGETIKGYAMYICEDEPEIVEIVVDDDHINIFVEKLFEYSAVNGSDRKIIFDESYFLKEQNHGFAFFISEKKVKKLLMSRIIDIRSFIKMISLKDCMEEYHIEIEDDIIKENNGRWDIFLREKSVIEEGKQNDNDYQKMTIAEFGEKIFSKIKFYLNEMV